MKQENVDINIGSKLDAKGFKQAETALSKLNKTVKSAAGAIGVAYGARAITQFGIAAVKAFSQDEVAALRLTTAVDNLGISFANPEIASYISNLEKTAAIADDILRPAFQGLLTTTGSLTQSQKLLNDAITISRGTGVELATVSQDLANGYVGITRGLKKYNSGLTTAELSSKSFSEILGVLLKQSSGAANAYLDTTSFKFDTLTIATDNAIESIGEGLVDALAKAGGGTEAADAITTMNNIAKAINGLTSAAGGAIGAIPNLLKNLGNLPSNIVQGFAGSAGAKRGISSLPIIEKPKPVPSKTAREKALEKLEKDAAKRARELAALTAKQTKALKEQTALQKAGGLFDIEQTQVIAALKSNITADERKRLELQLALLTGNTTEASILAGKLAYSQGLTKDLVDFYKNLPDAKNPFAGWKAYLDAIEAQVLTIAKAGTGGTGGTVSNAPITSNFGNMGLGDMRDFLPANPEFNKNFPQTVRVELVVDGTAIADAITVKQTNDSLSGNQIAINRRSGSFATP